MKTPKTTRLTFAVILMLLTAAVHAQCPCDSDEKPTTQPATQPAGR
ncbi:MAG TPA: hypothetical protein VF595_06360 [Tepidisphaeraceae bacterium]|jgi:hypothetical protein